MALSRFRAENRQVMLDLRGNAGLSKVADTFLQQNISSLMVYMRTIQAGLVCMGCRVAAPSLPCQTCLACLPRPLT